VSEGDLEWKDEKRRREKWEGGKEKREKCRE